MNRFLDQNTFSTKAISFPKKIKTKDNFPNINCVDYCKNDFFSPNLKQKTLLQNLDLTSSSQENNIVSPGKPINFQRFIIKGNLSFKKKSRSLSPEGKYAQTAAYTANSKLNIMKIKDIKKISQESEIKLQHLHGLLKQEIENDEFTKGTSKVSLCLQMINSVFMFSNFFIIKD